MVPVTYLKSSLRGSALLQGKALSSSHLCARYEVARCSIKSRLPRRLVFLLLSSCDALDISSITVLTMAVPLGSDPNYPFISGPSSLFNPTIKRRSPSAALRLTNSNHLLGGHHEDLPDPSPPLQPIRVDQQKQSNAHHLWRSRDNRKGSVHAPSVTQRNC